MTWLVACSKGLLHSFQEALRKKLALVFSVLGAFAFSTMAHAEEAKTEKSEKTEADGTKTSKKKSVKKKDDGSGTEKTVEKKETPPAK